MEECIICGGMVDEWNYSTTYEACYECLDYYTEEELETWGEY